MTASTCCAVEAAAHPHRHRVEGRERRVEGELTGCYSRRDMIQVVHQVLSEEVGLMVSITMIDNY